MCFCVIEETQHTPQVSMDFPVSFASTGSGKSPTGLYGFFCYFSGWEGSSRGGGPPTTYGKDPSHFGARREVQKVALKRNPSSRPSRVPFGRIGGHLGRKGGQKGCEMEVQKGVRNGAKSRAPTKS